MPRELVDKPAATQRQRPVRDATGGSAIGTGRATRRRPRRYSAVLGDGLRDLSPDFEVVLEIVELVGGIPARRFAQRTPVPAQMWVQLLCTPVPAPMWPGSVSVRYRRPRLRIAPCLVTSRKHFASIGRRPCAHSPPARARSCVRTSPVAEECRSPHCLPRRSGTYEWTFVDFARAVTRCNKSCARKDTARPIAAILSVDLPIAQLILQSTRPRSERQGHAPRARTRSIDRSASSFRLRTASSSSRANTDVSLRGSEADRALVLAGAVVGMVS